jgi:hypothetical protein
MSQTTLYLDGSYGATPGLVALASPALTNAIRFYDGRFFVGTARLSGNGTLASLTLTNPKPGILIYSAEYPGDAYYDNLSFGFVVVRIR